MPTLNERKEAVAEQDVDTIRGAYEAFDRGDVPAVLGILDAEVEWHEPGGGNAPSGTFMGRATSGARSSG